MRSAMVFDAKYTYMLLCYHARLVSEKARMLYAKGDPPEQVILWQRQSATLYHASRYFYRRHIMLECMREGRSPEGGRGRGLVRE